MRSGFGDAPTIVTTGRMESGTHDLAPANDHLFKVVFIGDSGVGKTCLLDRLFSDTFNERTTPTIGCDFRFKQYQFDGKVVGITLWDTAGAERFQALTSNYYRGAHGVVLVYDVTRRETLDSLQNYWLEEVAKYGTHPEAVKMVIGNKTDLTREVAPEEGAAFARANDCLYNETSAKSDAGVYDAFVWGVVATILDTPVLVNSFGADTLDIEVPRERGHRHPLCPCG